MPTYYMGMVDENNKVNFYDGKIRVVDPKGQEFLKFDSTRLPQTHRRTRRRMDLQQIPIPQSSRLERTKSQVADSGIYRVGPLGQLKRFKRHGNPTRAGRIRANVQDIRRQTSSQHTCIPLGKTHRTTIRN